MDDDEKGLDLSLGLPCGGNSSSQKSKHSTSSDIRSSGEGDRGSKLINEFKNFLEGGNQHNFAKSAPDLESPETSNTGYIWLANECRSTELDEDTRSSIGKKRKKSLFIESDLIDKTKVPHISITTDEGSTADNDDVAESDVDGSTSRQAPTMPMACTGPFRGQAVNMNASNSQPKKDINASGDRAGIEKKVVMPARFPLMFGYSPVQLPSLDKDNSHGIPHQSAEPTPYPGEEGSSSHTDHQVTKKDAPDQPRAAAAVEPSPCENPAIRPGIEAELKFGGCGSYPNLPWVSTTGQGPGGRTISGVTYRYSPTHIRIVCACHGSHMSPEEFVRHASDEDSRAPDALTPARAQM